MGSSLSVARADGCPVDHESMSKEQTEAFMSQHKAQQRADAVPAETKSTSKAASQTTPPSASSSSSSTCPVDHENMSKEEIAAFMATAGKQHEKYLSATSKQPSPGKSSVPQTQTANNPSNATTPAHGTVYDVYGQQLDASNMMPATPNQLPSPGQKQPLSTDRVQSTIPKNDNGSNWVYPSPQMFFNALKRKGKAGGVEESDMATVVAVHNRMNERTWEEVLEWEARFHCDECSNPTLKRFLGRPHDTSPAAFFRMFFRQYPRPFDRHDWIVDRCGQAEVRYIIDYYFRDNEADPIEIHVRPAINSFSTAYDRLRKGMLYLRSTVGLPIPAIPDTRDSQITAQSRDIQAIGIGHGSSSSALPDLLHKDQEEGQDQKALPSVVKGESLDSEEFSFLTGLTAQKVSEISQDVQTRCENVHANLAAAASDPTQAEQANISLNYCMAQSICKRQATGFMNALESGADPAEPYNEMTDCLDRFQIMARRAILEAAGVAQSGPEFPAGVIPSVSKPGNDAKPIPAQ